MVCTKSSEEIAYVIIVVTQGNVAVLRTYLGEITDHSNQARAFSYFTLTFALGGVGNFQFLQMFSDVSISTKSHFVS
jgi:hypothetical protein